MKIQKLKRPFLRAKDDVKAMYGKDGIAQFNKLKHFNPLFLLEEFFPYLFNAYSDSFKEQLFEEYKRRNGI